MSLLVREQWVIKLPQLQPLERVHLLIEAVACRRRETLYFMLVLANIGVVLSLLKFPDFM